MNNERRTPKFCRKDCNKCRHLSYMTDRKLGQPWGYECMKYELAHVLTHSMFTSDKEIEGKADTKE